MIMGLDMYLSANKYFYSTINDPVPTKIAELVGISTPVASISFRAMQWRKCHLINEWFIDKLSDHDIAQECELEREKLEELLTECTSALDSKPSYFDDKSSDFDYDDEEFTLEMQITKDGLEKCLKEFSKEFWFTYCASW
jgi:hypothetical protein